MMIVEAASILEISVSGYYDWLHRDYEHHNGVIHTDQEIIIAVRDVIRLSNNYVSGALNIHRQLQNKGISVGHKRLVRLMRSNGIYHRYHRKYVATTNSNHCLPRADNLLKRQFNAFELNEAWCGDITYIPTDDGWLYMASVIDLKTRRLVGYSFAPTMTTELIISALHKAIRDEHPTPGTIFHSDQGSQYCSHRFQELLTAHGFTCSMSERGQCWDNAVAESFWATVKRETLPLSGSFSSRAVAKRTIQNWIYYYNGFRLHSSLGMKTPFRFRQELPK